MKFSFCRLLAFLVCFLISSGKVQARADFTNFTNKAVEEEELNTTVIDLHGMPSSMVAGCVNVITGSYVESETDLILEGACPLYLQRSFNSSSSEKGNLSHGWNCNLHSEITVFDSEFTCDALVKDRGGQSHLKGKKRNSTTSLKVTKKMLRSGVTNCASGILSARTSLDNQLLRYKCGGRHCELRTEKGEILEYSVSKGRHDDITTYTLKKLSLNNGCRRDYHYKHDKLDAVQTKGSKGIKLHGLSLKYPKKISTLKKLHIEGSNGQSVQYKFRKMKSKDKEGKRRYLLEQVQRDYGPDIQYSYAFVGDHRMERMVKKSLPDERFLEVQYYKKGKNLVGNEQVSLSRKKDSRHGRVAALRTPAGYDSSPVLTWQFFYKLNRSKKSEKPIGGNTTTIDPLGNRSVYQFDNEERLTSVSHYKQGGSLYRKEVMRWGKKQDYTRLKSRSLQDGNGATIFKREYRYDKRGNVLEECFRGNLTGEGESVYKKQFSYSKRDLPISETDGKKTTGLFYYPGKDLLKMKLIESEGVVRERHYYEYDENAVGILEIIDDGTSRDIKNLEGVSQRLVRKIQPSKSAPIGLPEIISEYYLDLSQNKEVLLRKTQNHFSKEGWLLREETYDSTGTLRYARCWSYDHYGNVVEETNPLGQTTYYRYDQNGNCIRKQTPNSDYCTEYTYDYCNRLIKEEQVFADGSVLVQTYRYDAKGNRVEKVDIHGNAVRYIYDEFDRLVEKKYPAVANKDGELIESSDKVSYDAANNPISKLDCNGNETKLAYTAWGKPYWIDYPDGTLERSIYNVDGTLCKVIDLEGCQTVYEYDYKNRKTRENKFSIEGEKLYEKSWEYNAFRLLSETDPEGNRTVYEYDEAGRLVSKRWGYRETRYEYDALSRKSKEIELYSSERSRCTCFSYDLLNRVTEERVEDYDGSLLSLKSFVYDCDGNVSETIVHTSSGKSRESTSYNAFGQPLKITDPNGNAVHFEYDYNHRNTNGQTVLQVVEVDPKGNRTICEMDTRGRVAKEMRTDPLGELLRKTSHYYDGAGNLAQRIDHVVVNGEVLRKTITAFEYDCRDREIGVIEAMGEPEQKITRREYNYFGEVCEILKPDGVVIFQEYDLMGRLTEQRASDQSIHYTYVYDRNNNVTKVVDQINGSETTRTFDSCNQVIKEKLGNGLTVSYIYDKLGRVQQIKLPDGSSIDYTYNGHRLRSITRGTYEASYSYELSGNLSKVRLGSHAINYEYDIARRPIKIFGTHGEQKVEGYDSCGNILSIVNRDPSGQYRTTYQYDGNHQLVSENGSHCHKYSFDSLCNRISKNDVAYEVNALNQLMEQGDTSYQYDPCGNVRLKSGAEEVVCTYDALGRLTAYETDSLRAIYTYDAFHRRLGKRVCERIGNEWVEREEQQYIYQGEKEIGAVDEQGRVTELRVLGLTYGDLSTAALVEINGRPFIPINDYRGSITCLLDGEHCQPVEWYRHSAYGEETVETSDGGAAVNPWRFSGKRVDCETGWVFFGRRYYDPQIGRWTTPDPLWFEDGPNLYAYVQNRPTVYLDPNGLFLSSIFSHCYEGMANAFLRTAVREYAGEDVEYRPVTSSEYTVGDRRNDGMAITFINGIWNSREDSMESARAISNVAGGCEVRGLHNASYGLLDLAECGLAYAGVKTDPVEKLHKMWNRAFEELGEDGILVHICHSQGAIHTDNVLKSYDEEKRQRIIVLAMAPAKFIDEDLCQKAMNVCSQGDFVHRIQSLGFSGHPDNVVELPPSPDAGLIDHSFQSSTFKRWLSDEFVDLINDYGVN